MRKAFREAGDFITRHASAITSALFTLGNIWLFSKAGLHPDFDTAAGLSFLASSGGLALAKKYPIAAFRVAGAATILGAGFLSAKGVDFHNGQIVDTLRVISPLGSFGISGTLLSLQNEIAGIAKAATRSKNALMRGFAYTQEYPVALSAAIDSYGIIGTAISAAQHGDGQTVGIMSLWGAGAITLALSDPRIQKRLGYEPKPASALAAPPRP